MAQKHPFVLRYLCNEVIKMANNDGRYTNTSTIIIKHLQLETRTDNITGEITYRCRYQIPTGKYERTNKYTERFARSEDAIARAKELMRGIEDNVEIIDFTDFTIEQLLDEREKHVRNIPLKEQAASYKFNKVNEIIALKKYYTPKPILKLKSSKINDKHISAWCSHIFNATSPQTGERLSYSYYKKLLHQIRELIQFGASLSIIDDSNAEYFEYTIDRFIERNKKSKKVRTKDMSKRYLDEDVFIKEFLTTPKCPEGRFPAEETLDFNTFDLDARNYILFVLAFYTGMRSCEIRALTWSCFDFKHEDGYGRLYINKSVSLKVLPSDRDAYLDGTAIPKTESSRRVIVLEHNLTEDLLAYYDYYSEFHNLTDEQMADQLLFRGRTSKSTKSFKPYLSENAMTNAVKNRIEAMSQNRPKKFSMHDFRRSCARNLILDKQLSYDEVYPNFGHSTSKLLKEPYDTLTAENKSILTARAFEKVKNLRKQPKFKEE
ncbi:MAG: hypothetical protein E7192_07465 [Erysipelotrichaceae bacterium]|nr:hypothetical protein [Erysipelotrichaceae bacterium]